MCLKFSNAKIYNHFNHDLTMKISKIVLVGLLIAIIVGTAIYYSLARQNGTISQASLIGKPIPSTLYNQLVQLSNQGYNITVTETDFRVLPENFSDNGKPAVIYVGAEWCPFCGAERWALIIVLSRFGNFSNISYMMSSSTDVYPNTPTFSFAYSSYTSKYITFIPIEYQNREGEPLNKVPTPVYNVWKEYDNLSIPFIIVAYYYQTGTTIDPGLLSGHNWTYVINELHNPNSTIYKEIYAQANMITQMICQVDGNQPMTVCSHFEQTNNQTNSPLTMVNVQRISYSSP